MRPGARRTNWGAVSGILALVAIVAYDLIVPMPKVDPRMTRPIQDLRAEKTKLNKQNDAQKAKVDALTWQVGADEVGPRAMEWVNKTAEANFVTISTFRPQRKVEAEGLDQFNYLVTAEGAFPNVMDLIGAFESEGSLMAVKTVQLNSVDGASDTVRATLGVVAFRGADTNGS